MKYLILIMTLLGCSSSPSSAQEGYKIDKDNDTIEFYFSGVSTLKSVYVSANFNKWVNYNGQTENSEDWKMKYDANDKQWKLTKSFKAIQSFGSFLEFGFLVEGKLLDADRSAKNTIYCIGYGRRYVIK
jgi:hypothetical protein